MRHLMLIIFFIAVPVLYCIFRGEIINQWNNIESTIAILSYYTSLLFYTYLTNIRFHFFVIRLISVFRYDHTTWKFAAKLSSNDSHETIIRNIERMFAIGQNLIRSKLDNKIEILISNTFLVNIYVQSEGHENMVFVNTSKIVVPYKETRKKAAQITNLLETIDAAVKPNGEKEYSIDIEYNGKSPYYSFWIKKLPEEMIHNFNFSIVVPNTKDSKVMVNKNHLIISSKSYTTIFQLAKDYINLKSTT